MLLGDVGTGSCVAASSILGRSNLTLRSSTTLAGISFPDDTQVNFYPPPLPLGRYALPISGKCRVTPPLHDLQWISKTASNLRLEVLLEYRGLGAEHLLRLQFFDKMLGCRDKDYQNSVIL
jgi:hypothetical protein